MRFFKKKTEIVYYDFFDDFTGEILKINKGDYIKRVSKYFGNIPNNFIEYEFMIYECKQKIEKLFSLEEKCFIDNYLQNQKYYYKYVILKLPNTMSNEDAIYDSISSCITPLIIFNPKRALEILSYIETLNIRNSINNKLLTYNSYLHYLNQYKKDNHHIIWEIHIGMKLFDLLKENINDVESLNYYSEPLVKLFNNLYKLNEFDKAIEVSKFCTIHNIKDKTKGGWQSRLEKLQKAKEKYD